MREDGARRLKIKPLIIALACVLAAGQYVYDGWGYASDWSDLDLSDWTDIVAISAGGNHILGLKSDGTIAAAGNNQYGQCDAAGYKAKLPAAIGKP
jgi:alpha-tubulin suppressor-like RCC1 family protein